MKTTKKRRRTTREISAVRSNLDVNAGSNKMKTMKKEPCRRQRKKTGSSDTCSVEKNNHSPSKVQAVAEQRPVTGTCLSETTNCVLTLNQEPGELQDPARIKLQLFPIDVSTRKVLEKGGYNPHLELILSKQKKISSVLRHLKSKWGSVHNGGEIFLFPDNNQAGNLVGCQRWTSDDTKTRAFDIYEAIGSPTIFRLRYGWLANAEPETFRPPTFFQFKDCLQNESIKQAGTVDEIAELEKQLDKNVSKECCPISTNGLPNATEDKFVRADKADEPMDNPKIARALAPLSSIWGDSLTNISIGGLLSETSLHATANQTDPVAARSDASLQQIPFGCDSFDAAIAAHIYRHSQGPQRAPIASHSSFLDADETCHAFPCQKFASSGKYIITASKSEPVSCIETENIQAGITENQISQETKPDSPPHHPQENIYVSSSLGSTGINWVDSMGPFDLSLSRQLTGADNISLSSFLATSLDAFQNFSLFGGDSNVARS